MLLRGLWLGVALAAGFAGPACAVDLPAGAYVCTVEQKAGIAQEHLEGSDPPKAFIDDHVTRFRILVSPRKGAGARYRVEETVYSGKDRDTATWQTKNPVLHGVYLGDGWRFTSTEDQAFLRLDIASTESGWLFFYHAGFEYLDADHLNLSVRTGTCAPVR